MREAFDISFLTALKWSSGATPELLRVDQVLFLKPVSVGSITEFKSKITLIEEVEGVGQVLRVVTRAFNEFKEQTNRFNFLFVIKNAEPRYIMPETFDDILEYHEAKRRLQFEHIM